MNMRKFAQYGLAGRIKQLGTFTIPEYIAADGTKRDRELVVFDSINITKDNHVIIRGFVEKAKGRFEPRSIRVDRIRRVPIITGNRKHSRYVISANHLIRGQFKIL
jgi:hypothetical protein